ncbi:MAG: putative AAA+ family ATPase [Terrestrivirus sp.]|uniref:Putative AAA+ family ATPase n=1 Tax=Terrestrivirus sp. TaxID=2487775 RepID=A0A3G4ZS58_9VIRU|nr:MAG: putative AAA+ family ATPase [Terrestrivirus sp.]
MNSIKTQYALLDVVLIIIVMASMGLISDLIKKGFDKMSTAISNFSTSKKKSMIIISVTTRATGENTYDYAIDIPKQYLAILFYMYKNNIDPKYIRQINNQKYISMAGLTNENKMDVIKRNEENKYKYFLSYPYEIKINNDVRLRSECIKDEMKSDDKSTYRNGSGVVTYNLELYSYTLDSYQLKRTLYEWVEEYEIYLRKMNNNKLFYLIYDKYEEKERESIESKISQNYNGSNKRPTRLVPTFEIHDFVTNKSFNNIFFEGKDLLKKKLDIFINTKNNYERLGQQYSLGLLFHGKPGCGKTSTIKAIAKYTGRNVVSVSLSQIKTFKELRDAFFTEEYESINLSFDKKIIVFEDIDCMADIIKDRKHKNIKNKDKNTDFNSDNLNNLNNSNNSDNLDNSSNSNNSNNLDPNQPIIDTKTIALMGAISSKFDKMRMDDSINEKDQKITLSDFLNLMDGVLEQPGRIVIMTSNYPERIDKALLRFGRIDLKMEFKLCNKEIAKQIIEHYYETKLSSNLEITPYRFSPTDILELCFKCETVHEFIEKLYESDKNFEQNNQSDQSDQSDHSDQSDSIKNIYAENRLFDLDKFYENKKNTNEIKFDVS